MITLAAMLALAIACWCAAIDHALRNGSRNALIAHLDRQGRIDLRDWISERIDAASALIALAFIGLSLVFLCLWMLMLFGTDRPGPLSTIIGLATAGILIWVAGPVLGQAIARWCGDSLLVISLPLIRCAAADPIAGWISRFLSEIVRRLSGAHLHDPERAGEADLLRSIEAKQREGEIAAGAATLLENVVDFSTTDVGEVMTPRTEIEWIELTDDLTRIRAFILEAGHSRIPVFTEDLDHIEGILYVKDLIPFIGEDDADFELRPLLRRPILVPETKQVADLLADFQSAEVHMAIVVDEYGGTAGLATIEDVLEEIVGEIYDEHEADDDDDEPALTPDGPDAWLADGRFHIDDFNEAVEAKLPEDDEYDTIGGWFTARIGHVPSPGESVDCDGFRFTVVAAEPTHVTSLRITRKD